MKKIFTNDGFFLAMVVFAFLGEIGMSLICSIALDYSIFNFVPLLFRVICVCVLYTSYKKHLKNVMKGMMGALLATQVISAILYFSDCEFAIDYICTSVFAVFSTLLFINHFIINSEHTAKPHMVTFNQVIIIILFISNTIQEIACMVNCSAWGVVGYILDIFGFLGLTAVVVCVESRLDAYRLDREAAGWTEEEGYPEGYIHQMDR